jgi:hypothetical protein
LPERLHNVAQHFTSLREWLVEQVDPAMDQDIKRIEQQGALGSGDVAAY